MSSSLEDIMSMLTPKDGYKFKTFQEVEYDAKEPMNGMVAKVGFTVTTNGHSVGLFSCTFTDKEVLNQYLITKADKSQGYVAFKASGAICVQAYRLDGMLINGKLFPWKPL
jgi:hypothetical protein